MFIYHSGISNDEVKVIPEANMIPREIASAEWTRVVREFCEGNGHPVWVLCLGRKLGHGWEKERTKEQCQGGKLERSWCSGQCKPCGQYLGIAILSIRLFQSTHSNPLMT
jgi:hypothetical protein